MSTIQEPGYRQTDNRTVVVHLDVSSKPYSLETIRRALESSLPNSYSIEKIRLYTDRDGRQSVFFVLSTAEDATELVETTRCIDIDGSMRIPMWTRQTPTGHTTGAAQTQREQGVLGVRPGARRARSPSPSSSNVAEQFSHSRFVSMQIAPHCFLRDLEALREAGKRATPRFVVHSAKATSPEKGKFVPVMEVPHLGDVFATFARDIREFLFNREKEEALGSCRLGNFCALADYVALCYPCLSISSTNEESSESGHDIQHFSIRRLRPFNLAQDALSDICESAALAIPNDPRFYQRISVPGTIHADTVKSVASCHKLDAIAVGPADNAAGDIPYELVASFGEAVFQQLSVRVPTTVMIPTHLFRVETAVDVVSLPSLRKLGLVYVHSLRGKRLPATFGKSTYGEECEETLAITISDVKLEEGPSCLRIAPRVDHLAHGSSESTKIDYFRTSGLCSMLALYPRRTKEVDGLRQLGKQCEPQFSVHCAKSVDGHGVVPILEKHFTASATFFTEGMEELRRFCLSSTSTVVDGSASLANAECLLNAVHALMPALTVQTTAKQPTSSKRHNVLRFVLRKQGVAAPVLEHCAQLLSPTASALSQSPDTISYARVHVDDGTILSESLVEAAQTFAVCHGLDATAVSATELVLYRSFGFRALCSISAKRCVESAALLPLSLYQASRVSQFLQKFISGWPFYVYAVQRGNEAFPSDAQEGTVLVRWTDKPQSTGDTCTLIFSPVSKAKPPRGVRHVPVHRAKKTRPLRKVERCTEAVAPPVTRFHTPALTSSNSAHSLPPSVERESTTFVQPPPVRPYLQPPQVNTNGQGSSVPSVPRTTSAHSLPPSVERESTTFVQPPPCP